MRPIMADVRLVKVDDMKRSLTSLMAAAIN